MQNFIDYLITESTLQYHHSLNQDIWNGDTLDPEIRDKMLEIAKNFHEQLELPDFKILDIIFVGGNCGYNYTKYSDIDLHLVLDTTSKRCKECGIDMDDFLDTKKKYFNLKHDINIYEYDVELYAQTKDDKLESAGVYSVLHNKWLKHPEFNKDYKIDNNLIDRKAKQLKIKIDRIIKTHDYDELKALSTKIKHYRKSGLAKHGETSIENLVFKELRNTGYIDKLKGAKLKAIDNQLSLKESEGEKHKDDIHASKRNLFYLHKNKQLGLNDSYHKKMQQLLNDEKFIKDAHKVKHIQNKLEQVIDKYLKNSKTTTLVG
jgi:predicted amidophosphoribosyltransferase